MGKPEKKYLTKLIESVEDYCAEENVATIEEIYSGFGQPREVVNTYISNIDSSQLIKKIHFSKWIKRGIFILLLATLIGISIYVFFLHKSYNEFVRQSVYFEETEIY